MQSRSEQGACAFFCLLLTGSQNLLFDQLDFTLLLFAVKGLLKEVRKPILQLGFGCMTESQLAVIGLPVSFIIGFAFTLSCSAAARTICCYCFAILGHGCISGHRCCVIHHDVFFCRCYSRACSYSCSCCCCC